MIAWIAAWRNSGGHRNKQAFTQRARGMVGTRCLEQSSDELLGVLSHPPVDVLDFVFEGSSASPVTLCSGHVPGSTNDRLVENFFICTAKDRRLPHRLGYP